MNDEAWPDQLQALFTDASQSLADADFTEAVAHANRRAIRLRTARRIAVALGLALLLTPLQDMAMQVTTVLMTRMIETGSGVAAQLLAPLNTVAGLLSAVLLTVRGVYRRRWS